MMTWWMWMVAGLILMGCEMLTPGTFYFIFLGVSALAVGIVTLAIPLAAWVQWLLFSVFAVVSVAFFRRPLMQRFHLSGKQGHKVDSLMRETATALDDIPVGGIGKAELRGTSWTARNVGDRPLVRAERCKVEHVEGLTLNIRNE